MCKDKIRVSCRNTSGAALPHSPGTGSGQSHTSDCHSQDNARPPPGLPDGNTRTPSRTDPHILEEKARNNKRKSGKKPCVPDDAAGRSLPWQTFLRGNLFYSCSYFSPGQTGFFAICRRKGTSKEELPWLT